MALKTGQTAAVDTAAPADTMLLELAMYTNYTWKGTTYVKGRAYRFKKEDALELLSSQDHDRPIWRAHRAPRIKSTAPLPPVDSTNVIATRTRQSLEDAALQGDTSHKTKIDVGTDDEIADILNRNDTSGDVTV